MTVGLKRKTIGEDEFDLSLFPFSILTLIISYASYFADKSLCFNENSVQVDRITLLRKSQSVLESGDRVYRFEGRNLVYYLKCGPHAVKIKSFKHKGPRCEPSEWTLNKDYSQLIYKESTQDIYSYIFDLRSGFEQFLPDFSYFKAIQRCCFVGIDGKGTLVTTESLEGFRAFTYAHGALWFWNGKKLYQFQVTGFVDSNYIGDNLTLFITNSIFGLFDLKSGKIIEQHPIPKYLSRYK